MEARLRQLMNGGMLTSVLERHWVDQGTLEQDDFAQTFLDRGEAACDEIVHYSPRDRPLCDEDVVALCAFTNLRPWLGVLDALSWWSRT